MVRSDLSWVFHNEQVQQLVGSCSETLQTVASSGSSLVPYPAGASHQMDMNRYLSMQSTIRHLQTMLGKEVKDRKRQDEEMMARFEEFQKANQSLRDQLQEALKDKLRMEGEMHSNLQGAITSNNELQTTRKQLAELKRELNEAHSHIADLKSNKMALENKLAQSENCLKAAKVELQELEASKSSMRNVLQELQVQSETMKKEKEELEAANAALKCSVNLKILTRILKLYLDLCNFSLTEQGAWQSPGRTRRSPAIRTRVGTVSCFEVCVQQNESSSSL